MIRALLWVSSAVTQSLVLNPTLAAVESASGLGWLTPRSTQEPARVPCVPLLETPTPVEGER